LKTEKGGVVNGHNKKRKKIGNQRKRNRRPEANESVCLGVSLVPIHRDTQIDLKTEKGVVAIILRHLD
jgi:hypothetical protein